MDIKLNFSKPIDVSMRLEQDQMRVTFLNQNLIRHLDKPIVLGEAYLSLSKKIPR